ncbi:adenosylcobinamide-GDP ribazoletransferase [Geoalkalibacter subterraneus]|uniref:adenosylcobinamide-GDP ribazoletransferase n=1 Tax=Geoalkalibacter subterraneus TaxID=483547 RepID=UPI0006932606|nr:adenosylcobinamide-GDP ribazoletransferase [Geoalkalibacter subterraneus]
MRGFLSALNFLTLIRLGPATFDGARATAAFAWVGLLIGAGLALLHWLTPATISPLVMVLYLVVISGALHLDGLCDSADALFSHRDREKKLAIMRDVHAGTMGVVAIVIVLGAKGVAFAHINTIAVLVLVPALSRFAMVVAMQRLPYARPEGLARPFFASERPGLVIPGVILLALAFFALPFGLFIGILGVYLTFLALILWWYRRMIGGVTGDMLGALCEVCEAVLLLAAVALGG